VLSDAKIYDPSTQTCATAPSMPFARQRHTLTLLPSGKVLAAGGFSDANGFTPSANAVLFDPSASASGAWTALADMRQARGGHTATLLNDGRVLVFNGRDTGQAEGDYIEYFDPATNTWSAVATLASLGTTRSATLLSDGRVFFTTGGSNTDCDSALPSFILDPASNALTGLGGTAVRCFATTTLLASGKVLIVGGFNAPATFFATAELFDPAANTFTPTPPLTSARFTHTATLLGTGEVLVAGGGVSPATSEIYDPVSNTWRAGPALQKDRRLHLAVSDPRGGAILFSGLDTGADVPEIISAGLAPILATTPVLNAPSGALVVNQPTSFAGAGFRPALQAGGGDTQQSASNAPVFEIQRLDNGQRRFFSQSVLPFGLGPTTFTDSAFSSSADSLVGFPRGHALVRTWVNGVPSAARPVLFATTPYQPSAPTASVVSATSATITFNTAPFFNGGSALTKYGVETESGNAVGSCNMPCTSITAINLTPGSTYRFRVVAVNAVGEGARSPLSNSITLPGRTSTTAVVSSVNPATARKPVTFTATVSVAGGAALAGGGTMLFRADSNTIAGCSAVPVTLVSGNNIASCTTTTLGVQNWNISATFSGDAQTAFSFGTLVQTIDPAPSLNIDLSEAAGTISDATTDGIMILRYLAGFTGDAITNNAMHPSAERTPADAQLYLTLIRNALDVNADNRLDLAVDGLLIVRYMRGQRLATGLFNGIDVGTVMTTAQIESYLQLLMP
jgi:hypothetical protein